MFIGTVSTFYILNIVWFTMILMYKLYIFSSCELQQLVQEWCTYLPILKVTTESIIVIKLFENKIIYLIQII